MTVLRSHPVLVLRSFALAAAGGALFYLIGVPLPWMLGALLSMAAVSLMGWNFPVADRARGLGQVIAGVAVGLTFTPETAARLVALSGWMVAAALASILAGVTLGLVLSRVSGVDRVTAYFASMPGGVAEMSVLAERHGGNSALVSVSQLLRILLVVVTIPTLALVFDWHGAAASVDAGSLYVLSLLPILLMIGAAILCALVLGRFRIANSWLLGGLVAGATLALSATGQVAMPPLALIVGQVLIGCVLGSRFRRGAVERVGRFLPLTALVTFALIGFTLLVAWGIALHTGMSFATLALALAPGGVTEMSITAGTLMLGGAEVTAFHMVRIVMVVLLTGPIFRLMRRTGTVR